MEVFGMIVWRDALNCKKIEIARDNTRRASLLVRMSAGIYPKRVYGT